MALRVLAMVARRGAAVAVASTCAVLGPGTVYINQGQGPTGISTAPPACCLEKPHWPYHTDTSFSQQLCDNQSSLDFLKTAFVDSCYTKTEEREHQELGLDTQRLLFVARWSTCIRCYLLPFLCLFACPWFTIALPLV